MQYFFSFICKHYLNSLIYNILKIGCSGFLEGHFSHEIWKSRFPLKSWKFWYFKSSRNKKWLKWANFRLYSLFLISHMPCGKFLWFSEYFSDVFFSRKKVKTFKFSFLATSEAFLSVSSFSFETNAAHSPILVWNSKWLSMPAFRWGPSCFRCFFAKSLWKTSEFSGDSFLYLDP